MSMVAKSVLLFQLLLPGAILAQKIPFTIDVTVPAAMDDSSIGYRFFVDGADTPEPCLSLQKVLNSQSPHRLVALHMMCKLKHGKHMGLVKFEVYGYNPFTVHITQIDVYPPHENFALGLVDASASEKPRIEQILATSGPDQSIRFRMKIHNVAKRPLLITQFAMYGENLETCASPGRPPTIFQVSDNLIPSETTPERLSINWTIAEAGDDPNYPEKITGELVLAPCSKSYYNLAAPTNIAIPPQESFAIDLIIPPSKNTSTGMSKPRPGTTPLSLPTNQVLLLFRELRFIFESSDHDFPFMESSMVPYGN
jgi:hypothetical protein